MADKDHLDRETSVSVAVTQSGIEAKAKSRFVAAIDRLGGNLFEAVNARLEAGISSRRATIEGERKLIEAITKYGVDRIGSDDAFAQRALESHFRKIGEAQLNKDAVLAGALEDLTREPPHPSVAKQGPDQIDEAFMSCFEFYAEGATTENLRHRWGRVLASEVRRPGTFSPKALRVIDELSPEIASQFEKLCASRLANIIPKHLVGDLAYLTAANLATAGLLLEPGLGQMRKFLPTTADSGEELLTCTFERNAFGFPRLSKLVADKYLIIGDEPSLSAYVLTDVGQAISSILPDHQEAAFAQLFCHLKKLLTDVDLRCFALDAAANLWRRVEPPPCSDTPLG